MNCDRWHTKANEQYQNRINWLKKNKKKKRKKRRQKSKLPMGDRHERRYKIIR